jgi:hypothetical protein
MQHSGKQYAESLNDVIRLHENGLWNLDAERLRGLRIYRKVELRWVQDRQLRGLCAFENAADVLANLRVGPNQKGVAAKHASFGEKAKPVKIARTGKNALDFHLSHRLPGRQSR